MASQPPDTGRDRNQVRPLRSSVSSVRGKANRHRSTGVFGSHFVLDCDGSRKQAARFQDLLQQPSHPYLNGRANAESACVTSNRKSPLVSMATSLSIPYIRHQWLRDFPKTLDRSGIRSTLGGLPIKSSDLFVLGCCALRGSDRFTPTVSIRQRHLLPPSCLWIPLWSRLNIWKPYRSFWTKNCCAQLIRPPVAPSGTAPPWYVMLSARTCGN